MASSLRKKIENYYKNYYKEELNIPFWQSLVNQRMGEEKLEMVKIKRLERLLGKLKGKKILDVGCGTGGFVVAVKKSGADSYGVDPNEEVIKICKEKARLYNLSMQKFQIGRAEKIPFPSNCFDLVYAFTILEHVSDVEKSISEMVRVTKKGGQVYIHSPNYLSFYEGHYKIFWLPLFPKLLAKLYLFLRGRPTKFLSSINYLTPNLFKRLLKNQGVSYYFISHRRANNNRRRSTNFINFLHNIFKIDPQIELIIEKK